MPLTLLTVRCPEGVGSDRREVERGSMVIGRGAECDWVLPDPDKILSKRHCHIEARGDNWMVTDSSANGTMLNGSTLENDLPHPLRHNDRLTIGKYDIQVQIGPAQDFDQDDAPTRFGVRIEGVNEERLTGDPFPSLSDDAVEAARPGVGLPDNFDALSDNDHLHESPFTAADDTPDIHANFQPPRPTRDLLPEDWDLEDESRKAPAPRSPAVEVAPPRQEPVSEPAEPTPEPVSRFSVSPVTAPVPPAAPVPPPAPIPPPAPELQPPLPSGSAGSGTGFAAFQAGAGIRGAQPADPDAALRTLGAAFRSLVSGLRQSMIARASVKSEFRISQTMIQASGNNPLKFSADDNDALSALLGMGRQGMMSPDQAITDALRDIRLHELAVAAALQTAVRNLLGEFSPDKVMRELRESTLDDLLGRRKQAAWEAFTRRHAEVVHALDDEFDSVFGRSFARAYEAALDEVTTADRSAGSDGELEPRPRRSS